MKKIIKWTVIAVAAVVVGGIVGVVLNLDGIVRKAVEHGTSQSLALQTTLGKANVGLLKGDVSLGDLAIASPAGFKAPHLLTLGSVSVDTSYGKVFGDPTDINAIVIEKPKLVLEFVGTKSNLKTVADTLAASGSGDSPPASTPANAKPLRLIIESLKVSGAQVEILSDIPGLGTPYTIDIPAIEMNKIGNADGNKNGEEAGKIVSQIIARLTMEAEKSGKLPPQLAMILNGDLNDLIKGVGGQFQAQAMAQVDAIKGQAQDKINEMKDKAQDQLGKIGDLGGIGGMLGGKKDDDKKDDADKDKKKDKKK